MVKVWDESDSTVIETGGPLNQMRQNPSEENIIATGGKENDLKLWDLHTGKSTFSAKNVSSTWISVENNFRFQTKLQPLYGFTYYIHALKLNLLKPATASLTDHQEY